MIRNPSRQLSLPASPSSRRRRPGFTIIELVLVLAMLGIFGAIAVPKVSRAKQEAYTAAMIADLRLAALYEERYAIEKSGNYFSGKITAETPVLGFRSSKDITVTLTTVPALEGSPPSWSALARHANTDKQCELVSRAIICM